jgi:hypothetical protein
MFSTTSPPGVLGRDILRHQKEKGWGAKVIDRLAVDLRHAFPEVQGFSSRNLKYMRAFSEAYPDEQFVQQVAAQIAWFHNCLLLDIKKLAKISPLIPSASKQKRREIVQ